MKNRKLINAFTLIETILYLALFNVIFFAVISFTISISQSNKTSEYRNALEKNSIFVSEHLSDTLQNGNDINDIVFDPSIQSNRVRITNGSTYKEYYVIANTLYVHDSVQQYPLSDSYVEITQFEVEKVVDSENIAKGIYVKISMKAEKFTQETKTIESYYALR